MGKSVTPGFSFKVGLNENRLGWSRNPPNKSDDDEADKVRCHHHELKLHRFRVEETFQFDEELIDLDNWILLISILERIRGEKRVLAFFFVSYVIQKFSIYTYLFRRCWLLAGSARLSPTFPGRLLGAIVDERHLRPQTLLLPLVRCTGHYTIGWPYGLIS